MRTGRQRVWNYERDFSAFDVIRPFPHQMPDDKLHFPPSRLRSKTQAEMKFVFVAATCLRAFG